MSNDRPVVLAPACNTLLRGSATHIVGHEYVDAIRLAGGLPLVVPSADADDIDALLDLADGVLLTGSPSNVHPRHYGQPLHDARLPLDLARDAWTLPLIPRTVERAIPLLAICRGMQEMNVAFGGTLHQAVHERPGRLDHRHDATRTLDGQYAPAHVARLEPGGVLEALLGTLAIDVNSLHGQAIDRLADALRVEARAPDGVVEAVSLPAACGFVLGVQWHPEWNAARDPVSARLFAAFGRACRARRAMRCLSRV